jgi:hypothetical protein
MKHHITKTCSLRQFIRISVFGGGAVVRIRSAVNSNVLERTKHYANQQLYK